MGKKKNVRRASPGAAISVSEAGPKLAARLRDYEQMAGGGRRGKGGGGGLSFNDQAFHRPGSHKK